MYRSLLGFPVRYVDASQIAGLKPEEAIEQKAMEYAILKDVDGIEFEINFPDEQEALVALDDHFLSPDFQLCATDAEGQMLGNFRPASVDYKKGNDNKKGIATIYGTFEAPEVI